MNRSIRQKVKDNATKQEIREALEADVRAYLDSGKKIKQVSKKPQKKTQ